MAVAPRLHLDDPRLQPGVTVSLDAARAHYLARVLRLGIGDTVILFNARDGEWRARITGCERRAAQLRVEDLLRPPQAEPGPSLWFAPPRRTRLEWLVEKAVELGVTRLCPVITARTVARLQRPERLRSIAVEAAEQCRRMSLPEIAPARELGAVLAEERVPALLFADEGGAGRPLLTALQTHPGAAFLVGPEGGFTAAERAMLRARPEVVPVGLGPTILRSETAALYMLSGWRAVREVAAA